MKPVLLMECMERAKNCNFWVQLPDVLLNLLQSKQMNVQLGMRSATNTFYLASSSADRASRTMPCSWMLRIFAADSFSDEASIKERYSTTKIPDVANASRCFSLSRFSGTPGNMRSQTSRFSASGSRTWPVTSANCAAVMCNLSLSKSLTLCAKMKSSTRLCLTQERITYIPKACPLGLLELPWLRWVAFARCWDQWHLVLLNELDQRTRINHAYLQARLSCSYQALMVLMSPSELRLRFVDMHYTSPLVHLCSCP